MKKLLLAILLLPLALLANPIDDNCPQFVLHGAPVSKITNSQYLCKTNYAIHYRYDTKTAEYVVEHLTVEAIKGPAKRKDDFRPDPAIAKEHQSQLADYAGKPYDRGHLSPGANNTQNEIIMSESFFLSNMVPQVPNHNRGIWKQLETYVRNWAIEGKDIYVITGTIYDTDKSLTIGQNKVGVPASLWKVIVDKNTSKGIGFILPNKPLPVADLSKYATSIDEVEKATGLDFHPASKEFEEMESAKPNLSEWSGLK